MYKQYSYYYYICVVLQHFETSGAEKIAPLFS